MSVYAAPAPEPEPAGEDMDTQLAQLRQLAQLKDQGVLTEEEFAAQKAKIAAVPLSKRIAYVVLTAVAAAASVVSNRMVSGALHAVKYRSCPSKTPTFMSSIST